MKQNKISTCVVKALKLPKPSSHKGQNGRLLIIAGSKKYHGSLVYAIKVASRIVDLIYVLTTPENRELVKKLKDKTAEFITEEYNAKIAKFNANFANKIDCVLIGPGMGVSKQTYKLVEKVLKSKIKAVLDADALNVMDEKLLKLLNYSHIHTPHQREFEKMISTSPAPTRVGASSPRQGRREDILSRFAEYYQCTVLLKGKIDLIATPDGKIIQNKTGNAGMTKGGTGDVLAGLVAALFCLASRDPAQRDKNDAFTAAAAGAYINGRAGDELYKKVGPYYDAEDLVEEIPKTLWRVINHKSQAPNPK